MKFNIINYSGGASQSKEVFSNPTYTGQQLVRMSSYDEDLNTDAIFDCLEKGIGKIDFGRLTFEKRKDMQENDQLIISDWTREVNGRDYYNTHLTIHKKKYMGRENTNTIHITVNEYISGMINKKIFNMELHFYVGRDTDGKVKIMIGPKVHDTLLLDIEINILNKIKDWIYENCIDLKIDALRIFQNKTDEETEYLELLNYFKDNIDRYDDGIKNIVRVFNFYSKQKDYANEIEQIKKQYYQKMTQEKNKIFKSNIPVIEQLEEEITQLDQEIEQIIINIEQLSSITRSNKINSINELKEKINIIKTYLTIRQKNLKDQEEQRR